jgi:hypothetical protein
MWVSIEMKKTFCVLATWLGLTFPAFAVCGTPTQLFAGSNLTSGNPQTTTADAPIGSLIVVLIAAWNSSNGTVSSVTDSAGNTYTLAAQGAATVGIPYPSAIYFSSNTPNDLPNGGTITVTNSGAVNQSYGAWSVSGCNGGLDTHTTGNASGVTSSSLSTGALAQANEIVFGTTSTAGSLSGLANSAGFTEIAFAPSGNAMAGAYDVVSSTSSVTYNPSWSGSITVAQVLASFKATAAGGTATASQFLLLGAGP